MTADLGELERLAAEVSTGTPQEPVGTVKWCGAAILVANAVPDILRRLRAAEGALRRQADNMAFVLNHASLPEGWYDKFTRELAEDRAALSLTNGGGK